LEQRFFLRQQSSALGAGEFLSRRRAAKEADHDERQREQATQPAQAGQHNIDLPGKARHPSPSAADLLADGKVANPRLFRNECGTIAEYCAQLLRRGDVAAGKNAHCERAPTRTGDRA
jgi:hypothetical protein